MKRKQILLLSVVVSIPLFVLSIIFSPQLMHSKLLEFYSLIVFAAGYYLNHNPHQPNVFGMLAAQYVCSAVLGLVLVLLYSHASRRWMRQKENSGSDTHKDRA
jgi:hypothetical protein